MKNQKNVMKTNKTVLFQSTLSAAILLISASAFAEAGAGRGGSGNDGLISGDATCEHCPKKPISAEVPSFDALESIYEQGVQPTPEQITGGWKKVLQVGNPNLQYTTIFNGRNAEDETGIANDDGSLRSFFAFSSKTDPWMSEQEIVVMIKGLGNKSATQGPNEVSFRENSACFAQYSYGSNTKTISPNSYYFYKCRMVAHSTRLLCAIGFEADSDSLAPYQRTWLGRVVAYVGYTRAR